MLEVWTKCSTVFLRAKAINMITFGDGKEATFRADAVELRASLDDAAATKAIDAMLQKLKANWSKVSKALRAAKDAGSDDDDSDDDEESEPVTMETSMVEANFGGKCLGASGAIMAAAFLPKCT